VPIKKEEGTAAHCEFDIFVFRGCGFRTGGQPCSATTQAVWTSCIAANATVIAIIAIVAVVITANTAVDTIGVSPATGFQAHSSLKTLLQSSG
jgi:hypothetical protein